MLPADSLGTRNSGNKEAQKRASFNLRTKDRKFIEFRKKAQRGYCEKNLKKLELQQHKYNYIFLLGGNGMEKRKHRFLGRYNFRAAGFYSSIWNVRHGFS